MFKLYWQQFILPCWSLITVALIAFVLASIAGLAAPLIIKSLIDDALTAGNLDNLHLIIAGIVALYLCRGAFYYIYGYTMAKAGNRTVARLREKMFQRLQNQDYAYFINTPAGHNISLFTNDLWFLQEAVTLGLPDIIVEFLNLLAIMIIMVALNWELALVTFVTLPFIILVIGYFNKKIASQGTIVDEALAGITTMLHHYLLSVRVVQSYVREDYEYVKFRNMVRKAANDLLKVQRFKAVLIPLVEFMAAVGLTIIIWYGGKEVITGGLSIGGMFAFLVYIVNIPTPLKKISEASAKLQLGVAAWHRISSLDRQQNLVTDGNFHLPKAQGVIEFKNVSFSYEPKTGILNNITLTALPGDIVAIVGPSGAGKSSFANLILRFYDPTQGVIKLDGIDIRDIKLADLRDKIGFIQQEPILFNTTIYDNIRYGRLDATFEQVAEAAQIANAHEFIMELPKGYETIVGNLGGLLSGGQRQRIAIARAILRDPAVLLLDEPTAALDTNAEKLVMDAIRKASQGRTTFIITHRLSTLLSSDKVIYLADGQIIESGSQGELVTRDGRFAQLLQQELIKIQE